MGDKRTHRGPHPEDTELFAPATLPRLRCSVGDLSWLLSRGYAAPSALKTVGDRYGLTARQRMAVIRCACSDEALTQRRAREVAATCLAGEHVLIDAYNVLTTVEAALAAGALIIGRDGCWRDVASMHGTWRRVAETHPAIELVGSTLAELRVQRATWYLDSPVSNSGRLRQAIEQAARDHDWNWIAELVLSPDAILSRATQIVATADSAILDRCRQWFALAREVVQRHVAAAWLIDTAPAAAAPSLV